MIIACYEYAVGNGRRDIHIVGRNRNSIRSVIWRAAKINPLNFIVACRSRNTGGNGYRHRRWEVCPSRLIYGRRQAQLKFLNFACRGVSCEPLVNECQCRRYQMRNVCGDCGASAGGVEVDDEIAGYVSINGYSADAGNG